MKSKVLLLIFLFAINVSAILGQISCNYSLINDEYTCEMFINNPSGLNNFVSIGGTHLPGYTDSNVKRITTAAGSVTTNIPSIICAKFKSVQKMTLRALGITRVDDYSFISCTAMTRLEILENPVTTINEKAFNKNLNLQELQIYKTNLTTLPEYVFQYTQKLESFEITFSLIADLPEKIFWSLTNLKRLEISANQLTTLRSEWFENLKSLTDLFVAGNLIADFPKNVFNQLRNMQALIAFDNKLTTIHADSFGFLPNLKIILIDNNFIDAIDENVVDYTGVSLFNMIGNLCATGYIEDESVDRDFMRASLRECFNNYENKMSVCRQNSDILIESDKAMSHMSDNKVIHEMKKAWTKEKEQLLAVIKKLTVNKQ